MAEQLIRNEQVVGSIPTISSKTAVKRLPLFYAVNYSAQTLPVFCSENFFISLFNCFLRQGILIHINKEIRFNKYAVILISNIIIGMMMTYKIFYPFGNFFTEPKL